jgi:tryptophan synthase beta chain
MTTAARFGRFGGRYVAEALWAPLEHVALALDDALACGALVERATRWLDQRVGRPTPLTPLDRLSAAHSPHARLWVKREDLCQGGSFCVNAAVFQALLADLMGRDLLITESATGDFAVALASVAAALNKQVHVYMSREDIAAEPLAIARLAALNAHVEAVDSPHRGRRAPSAEARRQWLARQPDAFYCTSMLNSPDPYPRMLAQANRIIGVEARAQARRRNLQLAAVIAPVGSGAFAAGLLRDFIEDGGPRLIAVQAAGEGLDSEHHAASLLRGRFGVAQGTATLILQDDDANIITPHIQAAGLANSMTGPQLAHWAEQRTIEVAAVTDQQALHAARALLAAEGILASLEAAHAVAHALELLPTLPDGADVIVGLSGEGSRDLGRIRGLDD